MSDKSTKTKRRDSDASDRKARYEYRVWGEYRSARKLLRKLADSEVREEVSDCYLLVDDPTWNAKVRDNTLKIKQLVAEDKGFERWTSDKHRSAESAPSPFDELYDQLELDRLRTEKKFDIDDAVSRLAPDSGVRAVFVTKTRRRYRLGDLRAEVTDVEVTETGDVMRTLSIEGDELRDLVKLRKKLGLKGETNTPVHQAIDTDD